MYIGRFNAQKGFGLSILTIAILVVALFQSGMKGARTGHERGTSGARRFLTLLPIVSLVLVSKTVLQYIRRSYDVFLQWLMIPLEGEMHARGEAAP